MVSQAVVNGFSQPAFPDPWLGFNLLVLHIWVQGSSLYLFPNLAEILSVLKNDEVLK